MANKEHLGIIYKGPEAWNDWRAVNSKIRPDFIQADLVKANLANANLRWADLSGADLSGANLSGTDLSGASLDSAYLSGARFNKTSLKLANLRLAHLSRAKLANQDLRGANLNGAQLSGANLSGANLSGADLSGADLSEADLSHANLRHAGLIQTNLVWAVLIGADLRETTFIRANLIRADLSGAQLNGANLNSANLSVANLSGADLSEAHLAGTRLVQASLLRTNLSEANLEGAQLFEAYLGGTNFTSANLCAADFSNARLHHTALTDVDLRTVKGLESVDHWGPSSIGIDTLFKSKGEIPEVFLVGAGLPEDIITFVPSFLGRAIEFYSCFISYNHQDQEFSQRLYSRMRNENLRVWYAPEDMTAGKKLYEEIFHAIQVHDKLLVVLSENSMNSEWVTTEIRRAKKVEREENRRKLFPIRLVSFDAIQKWECFDTESGKDLAIDLREYYIPDFSNWKNHDSFEKEFVKLLRDLRATES